MSDTIAWQLDSIANELNLIRKLLAQSVELQYELGGYSARGELDGFKE